MATTTTTTTTTATATTMTRKDSTAICRQTGYNYRRDGEPEINLPFVGTEYIYKLITARLLHPETALNSQQPSSNANRVPFGLRELTL